MVGSESKMAAQGEMESAMQAADQQQPRNNQVPQLGRQSSVYSLTLDEFQNTLSENGKNFGSMNMDEFLTSILNAEENQQAVNLPPVVSSGDANTNNNAALSVGQTSKGLAKQPSLPRQGSFQLPVPLCKKTVNEVWSDIQRGQHAPHQSNTNASGGNSVPNSGPAATRQPTFGEMTLEDFLVRAGIGIEDTPEQPIAPPPQQFGMYQNNNLNAGPSYVSRPMIGMHGGGGAPAYQALPQGGNASVGESCAYAVNGHRNGGYGQPAGGFCYNGRVGNGGGIGGAYGPPGQGIGMPASISPVSSDGIGLGQGDNSMNPFGLGIGSSRGRKRIVDGPVEKVIERRQRRMIKNRESAARSRARKQAYTVELEAELNQLKEENAQLKLALAENERSKQQQPPDEVRMRAQTKAERAKGKLGVMRRSFSCPL